MKVWSDPLNSLQQSSEESNEHDQPFCVFSQQQATTTTLLGMGFLTSFRFTAIRKSVTVY
jgi:hypothetical protein